MSKKILGLDLGTNSIGWALIEQDFENKQGEILGIGSRILPMSQDILGKFDSGQSISQTAERTGFRGVRRLLERDLLRRERLHRVLNILNFLPKHYADEIDFEHRLGQFKKAKNRNLLIKKQHPKNLNLFFQIVLMKWLMISRKISLNYFLQKRMGRNQKYLMTGRFII